MLYLYYHIEWHTFEAVQDKTCNYLIFMISIIQNFYLDSGNPYFNFLKFKSEYEKKLLSFERMRAKIILDFGATALKLS